MDNEAIKHRGAFTLKLESNGAFCGWKLFPIANPDSPSRIYFRADGTPDETTSLDEALCQIHGWVKWDGCSELHVTRAGALGLDESRERLALIAWAESEAWLTLDDWDFEETRLPDGRELSRK